MSPEIMQLDCDYRGNSDHLNETGFYALIPAHVRFCKDIEMGAKMLYGEFTALTKKHGYCFASNKYLAELYGVDERTIQRWLVSLKEKCFIIVDIIKEGFKSYRKIWLSREIKEFFTARQNCHPRHDKSVTLDTTEMPYINIHSINNTSKETATVAPGKNFLQHNVNYQDPPSAAVPLRKEFPKQQLSKNPKQPQQKVHPCLKEIEIEFREKCWISNKYSEDIVKTALEWATHPQTKISTTLVQAIKWACLNKPEIPKKPEDEFEANKKAAAKLMKIVKQPKHLRIELLNKEVEFVYLGSAKQPIGLKYSEKRFLNQLQDALRKEGCVFQ